jgi:hypothetical protein
VVSSRGSTGRESSPAGAAGLAVTPFASSLGGAAGRRVLPNG